MSPDLDSTAQTGTPESKAGHAQPSTQPSPISRALMRNPQHSPSPRTVLFTDLGHILCSDLQWTAPNGDVIPLIDPPRPQIDALAQGNQVAHGVRLVAQRPDRSEPLPNAPAGRITYEDGLYRSWYSRPEYAPGRDFGSYSPDVPRALSICYTESKDGFEWSEPQSCPIELSPQTGPDGFTFFIDPAAPPEERYKAIWSGRVIGDEQARLWKEYQKVHLRCQDWRMRPDHVYGMYGAVSPDGVNWKAIPEPLMIHKSDTDTSVYFDTLLGKYVMYTRLYRHDRRWVGRAEADDFRHWGPVEPLLWPELGDHFADDIYTNARTEYPGLPEYHLMFPMLYHRFTQRSDVHLYSSADGICWSRVPGGPVITPEEPERGDAEFIHVSKDLVPVGSDRIAIRYMGTPFPHKYPRWDGVLQAGRSAWTSWPKGRLAAIKSDEYGEFYTAPLIPAGRELKLNLRTPRGGWVRVGIVGRAGRSVAECDPISGDSLSRTVSWNGQSDISVPAGEPVILHFQLRAAEVFGFEW